MIRVFCNDSVPVYYLQINLGTGQTYGSYQVSSGGSFIHRDAQILQRSGDLMILTGSEVGDKYTFCPVPSTELNKISITYLISKALDLLIK